MSYDLELDKVVRVIKREKAKKVLIQLPDGLKPEVKEIVDELESRFGGGGVEFFVWMGSCFGGCDVPNVSGIDLVVQFGHSSWNYSKKEFKVLN